MDIEFDKLIALQEIDNEIKALHHLLDLTPHKLSEIDQKIALAQDIVQKSKEKLLQNQKKRRELEGEVAVIKSKIATYKRQLNEVKTNKEYTALLKEIEEAQKKVDALEEEIIAALLEADDIEKEIQQAKENFLKEETRYLKEKEALLQRQQEGQNRLQALVRKREDLVNLMAQEQLALYNRIAEKKGGIAISPVTDDFCSMCHVRIRPQVLNELYDMKKIYLCENCGRILYLSPERKEKKQEGAKKAVSSARNSIK
ncbi:MAG: C4-type zinc ribbon domain-containing protein [Candidatus Aminicenantes bacterium]|nr:C4-type zinc ribbon domain-containing protein [Candidatus Aminicenantes bacterium]